MKFCTLSFLVNISANWIDDKKHTPQVLLYSFMQETFVSSTVTIFFVRLSVISVHANMSSLKWGFRGKKEVIISFEGVQCFWNFKVKQNWSLFWLPDKRGFEALTYTILYTIFTTRCFQLNFSALSFTIILIKLLCTCSIFISLSIFSGENLINQGFI